MTEDGKITLLGRGSVCINSGGMKIFPEEVEQVVKAHPHVFDALVVGAPSERWTEQVGTVVQLRPGKSLTLEDLQAHCRDHIASFKVPRAIQFVEKMQRSPSGKPDYPWAAKCFTDND
jgi:acyl-CoA synthetase (AMP-forming)/AMP-acid ligase II